MDARETCAVPEEAARERWIGGGAGRTGRELVPKDLVPHSGRIEGATRLAAKGSKPVGSTDKREVTVGFFYGVHEGRHGGLTLGVASLGSNEKQEQQVTGARD